MADPVPVRRRRRPAGWLILATFVAVAIAMPVAALAGGSPIADRDAIGRLVDRPGESCPDATPAPDASDVCIDVNNPDIPGGGGLDLGIVLPVLGAALVGGVVALVGAFLVLRRRASAPFAPADAGEWWICRTCGKSNVAGSARCYACGTWQS